MYALKKVSLNTTMTFHAKQYRKKFNWKNICSWRETNWIKILSSLASCPAAGEPKGQRKWPTLTQESESALCVPLTMAFTPLPAHSSFLHSLICRKGAWLEEKSSACLQLFPRRGLINQEEQTTVTFRMEPAGHHTGKTARGYLCCPEQDTSFVLHQARQRLVLFIPQVVAQSPDTHFHCSYSLRDFLASKIGLYNSFNIFCYQITHLLGNPKLNKQGSHPVC